MSVPVTLADRERLSPEQGKKLVSMAALAVVVGALATGAGYLLDPARFGFAYLAAFVWVVMVGLGALFFVLLQHLTRAGWSVAARRHMEWIAQVLPASVLLFVPVALCARRVFPWMAGGSQSALVHGKAAYLNPVFFFVRAGVYFAVWSVIALVYAGLSRRQDDHPDPMLTARMQRMSAPAMVLFALTTTFAGFDWLMSLQPEWYSTIFGVYVFSGAVTSSLAVLVLVTIALQKARLLSHVSNREHLHDIGKYLFGFTIFWAYIAFSQYFLIWYANIPEETVFYRARWGEGWHTVSLLLMALHFAVPFLALLPRAAKRSPFALGLVAMVVLAAHAVDVYWLVLPAMQGHAGPMPHLSDALASALPVAALFAVVAQRMASGRLFPPHDPRLAEAVQFTNT